MNTFKATILIHGKIECLTGMRIGGSGGGYEIGGMENAVIRNPVDEFPYIPGSSLKGKMRSLLEWFEGKVTQQSQGENGKPLEAGRVYWSNNPDDEISRIFGAPAEANRLAGPTRLIVRDAVPDETTKKMMRRLREEQGLPFVEIKTEVNINRITSKPSSGGPRSVERVPVGSRFDFELVFAVYEVAGLKIKDIDLLEKVFTALRLVEDSALGGSGSRGYGQVQFHIGDPLVRLPADYAAGVSKPKTPASDAELQTFKKLKDFDAQAIELLKEQLAAQLNPASTNVTPPTEEPAQ
jgi:CRISPR-associated protein Csm3